MDKTYSSIEDIKVETSRRRRRNHGELHHAAQQRTFSVSALGGPRQAKRLIHYRKSVAFCLFGCPPRSFVQWIVLRQSIIRVTHPGRAWASVGRLPPTCSVICIAPCIELLAQNATQRSVMQEHFERYESATLKSADETKLSDQIFSMIQMK